MSVAGEGCIVPLSELHGFIVRCMVALDVPRDHGVDLADLLVAADYRGHFSHGLNRLDMYITDVKTKTTATQGSPKIVKETAATALVDGDNILGPVIGKFCIDLAIEKAKEAGIGWVSARNSNHFGIAGWYGIRAVEKGMLMDKHIANMNRVEGCGHSGMSFTNTSPFLVPTNSKKPALGTNPICMAAPAKDGDSFVLDMATTSVAVGKIELAERRGEKIPVGWAVDKDGNPLTEPGQQVGLSPLGGEAKTSGYKGYGLGMMVEVFCGILSGATYGPFVRSWKDKHSLANLGQCFVAINPEAFEDGFTERMSDLMSYCRNLEPVEGADEVMVAGDPERKHMAKCDKQGGILYHPNQITNANDIAKSLGISPMKTL